MIYNTMRITLVMLLLAVGLVSLAMAADSPVISALPSCCVDRGNVDNSTGGGGPIDVSDLTYLVGYLFTGGASPPCIEQGNVDGIAGAGGPIDVSDLTYLVAYLFVGGPQPPPCPGDTVVSVSEAHAITFLESVLNGIYHKYGYSVTATSRLVTTSSVSYALTHVEADLVFETVHDAGGVCSFSGPATIEIQNLSTTDQIIDVSFSMTCAGSEISGSYSADHDLVIPTLDETVSATLVEGIDTSFYSVDKAKIRSGDPCAEVTTTTAIVSLDDKSWVVYIQRLEECLDDSTTKVTCSLTSSSSSGDEYELHSEAISVINSDDEGTATFIKYDLTLNSQPWSLGPGINSVSTTRLAADSFLIGYDLTLEHTTLGIRSVSVSGMVGIGPHLPLGPLEDEDDGWSWGGFWKATVVTAGAGAAGGAVVGTIATDCAAPIGAGAGAITGGVGGAVTGAVGYTLVKAWDWVFGSKVGYGATVPGEDEHSLMLQTFDHQCHFGGVMEYDQTASATAK